LWIGTVESFGLRHSRGRSVSLIRALQAKHRSTSALDAAMVLLKSVIKVATRPVPHMIAELGPNGSGIGVMAVGGDAIRCDASHRLGRSKERLGCRQVAVLAQHDINKRAIAINRAI
jgi:hypothetical protein